jgi:D-galactose 1-dehydrogenase
MTLPTLGLVGLGKIARDQHIPAIAATGLFELAAVVSPDGATADGVPTFRSQAEMLAALPGLDAVALCTPPAVRHGLTVEALRAGCHVLIEKPPAATLSELHDLVAEAEAARRTLFTAWHSQFNPAVEETRRRLANIISHGATIRSVAITWKEDVRRWHPGQDWIFAAGGFGVFDPGINALSILTDILPAPVFVRAADLQVPANRDTPVAATLEMSAASGSRIGRVTADFDFLQQGEQTWSIVIEIDGETGGGRLDLTHGGTRLIVDGVPVLAEPDTEYQRIYRHFHRLIGDGASDVDARPLSLVADACMVGRWHRTDAFDW